MSNCPNCGNRNYLCQQCKMDELEDRFGTPGDQDVDLWILEDGLWHASVAFDGETHTCGCSETVDIPVTRGTSEEQVRQLLQQYKMMEKTIKQFQGMGSDQEMQRMMQQMQQGGGGGGGGMGGMGPFG